ncbi:MAG: YaaL family protein [Firmicutes bacterium]|jgi:KaiC/GvpD/RAD55 family RecA-like ATPase|nr:DUF2508 family protein [Bacillota bacterium]NLL89156.1 YaaL family protein [Bacillota bacterium]
MEQRSSLLHKFALWLFSDPDANEFDTFAEVDQASLRQQVEEAKDAWLAARSYFDSLTDPELIDYAIYSLEAAERKYMYLLKKYKSQCSS